MSSDDKVYFDLTVEQYVPDDWPEDWGSPLRVTIKSNNRLFQEHLYRTHYLQYTHHQPLTFDQWLEDCVEEYKTTFMEIVADSFAARGIIWDMMTYIHEGRFANTGVTTDEYYFVKLVRALDELWD